MDGAIWTVRFGLGRLRVGGLGLGQSRMASATFHRCPCLPRIRAAGIAPGRAVPGPRGVAVATAGASLGLCWPRLGWWPWPPRKAQRLRWVWPLRSCRRRQGAWQCRGCCRRLRFRPSRRVRRGRCCQRCQRRRPRAAPRHRLLARVPSATRRFRPWTEEICGVAARCCAAPSTNPAPSWPASPARRWRRSCEAW